MKDKRRGAIGPRAVLIGCGGPEWALGRAATFPSPKVMIAPRQPETWLLCSLLCMRPRCLFFLVSCRLSVYLDPFPKALHRQIYACDAECFACRVHERHRQNLKD